MKIKLPTHGFRAMAICLILFACLLPQKASAQNEPIFTQSWALPTLYNPGAAGDTDFLRIRGGARLQWVGIPNAPKVSPPQATCHSRCLPTSVSEPG